MKLNYILLIIGFPLKRFLPKRKTNKKSVAAIKQEYFLPLIVHS